jgi:uncharacterized protein
MHIRIDPALYQQLGISHSIFSTSDGYTEEDYHGDTKVAGVYSNGLPKRPVYYTKGLEGRDCDGDCNHHSFNKSIVSPLSLQEQVRSIWHHKLRCSQDLYLTKCDDTHWLACNPIDQGTVVVLDEEARALLELFRSERTLKDAAKRWANDAEYNLDQPSLMQKAQMVTLFVILGLIIDICEYKNNLPVSPFYKVQTLSAWLHVTNACNMRCSYCYVSKSTEHMADDVGKRAVDAVFRSAISSDYQQVHLKYAGGEALLRLSQVLALHDYALQQAEQRGLHLSATLLSNGAALTPRAIQQLKQRDISVTISLDGIGEDHDKQRPFLNGMGSFRLVDRAITRLLAQDLVPYINVTVSQRNLAGLPNLVAYLLEHDLPFSFSYYRENDCSATLSDLQFSEEQMISGMKAAFTYIEQHLTPRRVYSSLIDKASLTTPHHQTCGVGRNYLVIDQHGGVARCQTEIMQTITTIDAEDPLQEIRMQQAGAQVLDVDEKEGCHNCNWRYWCAGGCAVLTYRLTGRNDIRSPNCGIYKALFPEALRLEALRLLKYTPGLTLHI